ncbi:hypothetical protein NP493_425g01022 [Ridgeia piscesae]|uniref:UBP34/UBP24/USP9X/USP9Y-like ARM repeat region domain-containing protein n=1 Tax=Ridgeia piscesae TaxID=27915 RepID=A0AAD9NSI5_RIDPI|nr:hypothetical protein NP493_425g01022 [Ridgeia piscesae]
MKVLVVDSVKVLVVDSVKMLVVDSVKMLVVDSVKMLVVDSVNVLVVDSVKVLVVDSVNVLVVDSVKMLLVDSVKMLIVNSVKVLVVDSVKAGKHEAIVKNLHDLLAKLAWDFSPEQLDHLFECFQGSWAHATKKQREKLLELIRRLAEDDKEGVMAYKVLGLLWNLAHSDDVPTDIMDQALSAQIKILDFSCSQAPQNFPHTQRTPHMYYRNQVISHLQSQHSIVMLVTQNLTAYMNKARSYYKWNSQDFFGL